MKNDDHLFSVARENSFKSDYNGNARVGCVITYKKTILANGFNSDKTHTVQSQYNKWRYKDSGNKYLPPRVHSEIAALAKIRYLDIDFSRIHVYVYRELKNGHVAIARPCPSCMAMIKKMGIKNIHYTTNDGYAHEVLKDIEE